MRNISGLDKRRVIKNQLYTDKKFVPEEYLETISDKIIESLALKPSKKSEEKVLTQSKSGDTINMKVEY